MGRSVYVPYNAVVTVYFHIDNEVDSDGEYDEFLSVLTFKDMISNIQCALHKLHDSFTEADRFDGREGHIISESDICEVILSEYCGICSLSFVPVEECPEGLWDAVKDTWDDLASAWVSSKEEEIFNLLKSNCGLDLLNYCGSFSNGEAVFQKV